MEASSFPAKLPSELPKTEPGKLGFSFTLLPHEFFFGLFLLLTWIRLCFVEGFLGADTLLYLLLIGANAASIWLTRSMQKASFRRAALLFYPIAMNVVFANMKVAIPKLHAEKMDPLLFRFDTLLIGQNLSLRLQPLVHPLLTEVFSFCYFLFFLYLLFSLVYYFVSELNLLVKFVIGLFTIYGLGFIGYSFVPASGPCHAMADQFNVPLSGWWMTRLNDAVVARGSNGVDVFPSLHCAISTFFLFFDRRHRPWRFKLYLVPCLGLWLSTIYLRYHYAVDVICGFALAGFALFLAQRYPTSRTVFYPRTNQ
jgi:hypothetical protein